MATRQNTLLIKRSNVIDKIPPISGLTIGELALNTADAKLYTIFTSGTTGATEVREIGWDRIHRTGDTVTGDFNFFGDITISGSSQPNGYALAVTGDTNLQGLTATTISVNTIGVSGDCVDDIYVSKIHSCGPLLINPNNEGNVFFGSTSGVTIDVTNGRLGLGTTTPTQRLQVSGNTLINGSLTGQTAVISGSGQNILTVIGSGNTTSSPLFAVQGSSGELFSISDSLIGSLFSVNDISGLPILEVFSDNTVLIGSYLAPSLNTTVKTTANSGTTSIYSIPQSAYTGAFFEYTVSDGTNLRAGSVMSIWSGTTVNYTETQTTDIGNTSGITFLMSATTTNAILQTSATTNNWTVKTIVRSI